MTRRRRHSRHTFPTSGDEERRDRIHDQVEARVAKRPPVSEDDVAEDEHAPAIAEHLDGGVDRAPRPRLPPPGTTVSESGCKPQAEGAPC
jgi:hypothetical protein